jgi:hypothetical protein
MPDKPSRLWKDLPPDTRLDAALAFWRDVESPDIAAQHAEAMALLARRLNFRAKSIQALPVDRRARHLAHIGDVSDLVATRALIAYHFSAKRELMSAFLDALGITHDSGLITAEQVLPPSLDRLTAAREGLKATFGEAEIDLYLRTLVALDADTWVNLDSLLGPRG